jgi:hypothetical protein
LPAAPSIPSGSIREIKAFYAVPKDDVEKIFNPALNPNDLKVPSKLSASWNAIKSVFWLNAIGAQATGKSHTFPGVPLKWTTKNKPFLIQRDANCLKHWARALLQPLRVAAYSPVR